MKLICKLFSIDTCRLFFQSPALNLGTRNIVYFVSISDSEHFTQSILVNIYSCALTVDSFLKFVIIYLFIFGFAATPNCALSLLQAMHRAHSSAEFWRTI